MSLSDEDALFQQPDAVINNNQGLLRQTFPLVLYDMLDDAEAKGYSHIVSWQPHGMCFVVHKRRAFVERIMPIFWRSSKFESFLRQVNLYGFHRITRGLDQGGYFHEHFRRGRRDLCENIVRRQIKGRHTSISSGASESNPNFYMMNYVLAGTGPTNNTDQQMVLSRGCVSNVMIPNISTLPTSHAATMGQEIPPSFTRDSGFPNSAMPHISWLPTSVCDSAGASGNCHSAPAHDGTVATGITTSLPHHVVGSNHWQMPNNLRNIQLPEALNVPQAMMYVPQATNAPMTNSALSNGMWESSNNAEPKGSMMSSSNSAFVSCALPPPPTTPQEQQQLQRRQHHQEHHQEQQPTFLCNNMSSVSSLDASLAGLNFEISDNGTTDESRYC